MSNEQVEVPILIKLSGNTPSRLIHPLSQIDIFPTLFNALGVPSTVIQGISPGASVLSPTSSQSFTLTNKINGYSNYPEEFVITDGFQKATFRLKIGRDRLVPSTLILKEILDREGHPITNLNTVEKLRSHFRSHFIFGLEQTGILRFL